METLIQSIPAAIPLVLPLVLVLMVVTNIIVEVLKNLTYNKMPTNILAFIVAMVVTLAAFFAACQIADIPVAWYTVVAAIVLGFFVCLAAIYGFDKLKQTMETAASTASSRRMNDTRPSANELHWPGGAFFVSALSGGLSAGQTTGCPRVFPPDNIEAKIG